MITLYHHPMSAASRTARLLLAEYDTGVTLQEEILWERRDEFLQMNPAATLPVLVENGHTVCGANAVFEYLDETRGAMKREHRVYPDDPGQRAEMRRIVDWALVKLETEVVRYLVHERITKRQMPASAGGGAPDSQALRAARANITYHLQYFGWLATTRNWLGGEHRTNADLAAASALSILDYLGEIEWNEHDALKDWYARMKSRPSFRPLLADRLRGIPPVSHYVDLDF